MTFSMQSRASFFVLQPITLLYRIGASHVPCVIYFSNDYTVSLESNCPCRFLYSRGIYISKLVCCNNMMATSAFNSDRLHHSTHEQRGSNSYQPFLILLVCSVDITCLPCFIWLCQHTAGRKPIHQLSFFWIIRSVC